MCWTPLCATNTNSVNKTCAVLSYKELEVKTNRTSLNVYYETKVKAATGTKIWQI